MRLRRVSSPSCFLLLPAAAAATLAAGPQNLPTRQTQAATSPYYYARNSTALTLGQPAAIPASLSAAARRASNTLTFLDWDLASSGPSVDYTKWNLTVELYPSSEATTTLFYLTAPSAGVLPPGTGSLCLGLIPTGLTAAATSSFDTSGGDYVVSDDCDRALRFAVSSFDGNEDEGGLSGESGGCPVLRELPVECVAAGGLVEPVEMRVLNFTTSDQIEGTIVERKPFAVYQAPKAATDEELQRAQQNVWIVTMMWDRVSDGKSYLRSGEIKAIQVGPFDATEDEEDDAGAEEGDSDNGSGGSGIRIPQSNAGVTWASIVASTVAFYVWVLP